MLNRSEIEDMLNSPEIVQGILTAMKADPEFEQKALELEAQLQKPEQWEAVREALVELLVTEDQKYFFVG